MKSHRSQRSQNPFGILEFGQLESAGDECSCDLDPLRFIFRIRGNQLVIGHSFVSTLATRSASTGLGIPVDDVIDPARELFFAGTPKPVLEISGRISGQELEDFQTVYGLTDIGFNCGHPYAP